MVANYKNLGVGMSPENLKKVSVSRVQSKARECKTQK